MEINYASGRTFIDTDGFCRIFQHTVTRHDIKDKKSIGIMSEAYPHLILDNFSISRKVWVQYAADTANTMKLIQKKRSEIEATYYCFKISVPRKCEIRKP
ncbi:hypothetical protein MKX03_028112 [Papaver bracteatum]|nr:hypothetical protein MKX03_028112 [Papaver bracteatum]